MDFVNTVSWRGGPQDCGERLTSFDELLTWAAAAGAVERKQVSAVAAAANASPRKSAAALADAIVLREAIARLLLGKSDASAVDLATLNRILREAPQRAVLARQGARFDWHDGDKIDPLRLILVRVARSATDILTSDKLERIRSCHDERCSWLFVDNSRTGERRWCNMKTCGNRSKARLHYQRVTRQPASRSRAR